MKTEFIPIDYDYFDFQGKNYIRIFGRDKNYKRICLIDSCDVYLWAILKKDLSELKINKLIKKINKIKLDVKARKTKVEKVELHNKNYLGKKVKALKIFATNYKDLHDIANKLSFSEIEKRRGYDLGFITHYIIEKKLNPLQWYEVSGEMLNNSLEFGGMDSILNVDFCIKLNSFKKSSKKEFSPKVLAYDIETDDLQIGKGEILMISLVSKNFKKVITWKKVNFENKIFMLPDDGSLHSLSSAEASSNETWEKSKEKQNWVEYVDDETELLEKFVEYVKKISPDFLVGYFSDGFDLPYIKARAEKNKIKLNLGVDGSQPRFSRGINLTGKIKGIVHIDILKFIRTTYSQYMKSETLSLNEVSKEFLEDEKKKFELKHSSEIKKSDWKNYYEYNLHDSVLTFQLFEKFWPDLWEFTKIIQEPVFDISRNGLSKQVESYILHNLEKFNEIPERKPGYTEILERKKMKKYKGAFVFEPTPGLYENLAMFDFTSSYASTIVTYNLSKSTFLEKKEKNSYCIQTEKEKLYFTKKQGFVPEILKSIIEKRKKYKQELKKNSSVIKKARSNAFKLLANSYYGYQGFFGARYYCREAAIATAGFARESIKNAIEKIKKAKYKIIYSDTDSICFLLNKKSQKQTKDFLKKLNKEMPGIMELELEGFFKRGLWVTTRAGTIGAKKKYALIDEKNKIKIRGFETVRRDWCKLARNLQNKIIKQILKDGNEKKSLDYAKEIIKKIKQRKINKKELIIKTQLKKPISEYKSISPHVVAAKKMKEQGIPISQGNLIEYYVAETKGNKKLVGDKVKLPNEEGEYNIKYYLEHQILPSIENIFKVFNVNLKEIVEGKKQMTLGDFK